MSDQVEKRPTLRQIEELLSKARHGSISRARLQGLIDGKLIRKTEARAVACRGNGRSSKVYDIGNRVDRLIKRGYHRRQPGGGMTPHEYRRLWPNRICMPVEYVERGYNHVVLVDVAALDEELVRGSLIYRHSVESTTDCVDLPKKRDGSHSQRYILFVYLDHKLCRHGRGVSVRDALATLLPDERGLTTNEVFHWVAQLSGRTDGFRCVAAGSRFGAPGVPIIHFGKRDATFDGINIDKEQSSFVMPVAGTTVIVADDVMTLG